MFLEIQTNLNVPEKLDKIFINLKKQAISVSINTFTIYTFDLVGRLITAVSDGHTFHRSLDNQIMEKWSVSVNNQKKRVRRWLNLKKKRAFLESIHELFWKLYCLLQQNQFVIMATDEKDVGKAKQNVLIAFKKILFFDYFQLEKDSQTFSSIYRSVGILPPDMYLSILLQATEGCAYNKCSYCNFYKGQLYQIKSESEFRQHIHAVKDYFGESIKLRKFLFLGEANALDISQSTLLTFFDAINQQFIFFDSDVKSEVDSAWSALDGIYSFLTAFHKNQKSADDFSELRAKNLRRVYIGMETGCDELLKFLNKPGKVENVLGLVQAIKMGGVNVGIIILLGAGGDKYYESHTNKTVQAIKEMKLGNGDIIFFSPLIQFPGTQYEYKTKANKIHHLTKEEIDNQRKKMIEGFGFKKDEKSPKMALYDINEFIY